MTLCKAGAISLILIAGTIPVGLSGCNYSAHGKALLNRGSDGSTETGTVRIAKMGGEIDVTEAPHGADLATMGGNIHVGDVASFVKVKTMGGVIAIDHATGSVDATTMGGGITIGHADGPIKASTMGGDITARLITTSADRRDVELTSLGGTITLTVPKDFPMDVRIILAYTKNAPRTYEIIDHIGLDQRETPDWDNSMGSPRKYIRAQGRVGNGSNHVTIKTTNGDVILKQE
jgi:DUF4097 and DUF4098 domain-containing protein YvlB